MLILKEVLMVGATDRFNYGDLLFPHLVQNSLVRINNDRFDLKFSNYSTKKTDLSEFGALPTLNIHSFFKKCDNIKTQANVILIGGGILAVDWLILYTMVSKPLYILYNSKIPKKRKLSKLYLKYVFYPKSKYPFVYEKDQFRGIKSICFNSVGDAYDSPVEMLKRVSVNADYISLRTEADIEAFTSVSDKAKLVPDSAIIMSDFWKKDELELLVRSNLKPAESYIFFQLNENQRKWGIDLICEQLEKIYCDTKLPIVLCPIGTALGHNDQSILSEIDIHLKIPHKLIYKPTIWEIMYLISNSKLYIGTSLHGIITAMSFIVPYIGFNNIGKAKNFLATWSITELKETISISDLAIRVSTVLSLDVNEKLNHQLMVLKERVWKSLYEIYNQIVK